MSESVASEKAPKKSWFKGLKSEFKKIVWPDKKSVAKQTAAVAIISVLLGALIKVLDMVIQLGIDLIV
ncbi:MAG TPA: preprotein translocase subunit SecE [Candidatus Merdenecus merdavium]|nr:preprotein translocase subunit SecE [Candidatus Merdenecus merdavium]